MENYMRILWLAPLLLSLLAACSTEKIYMKNEATGATAKCGGHSMAFPIYATVASAHDSDCVQDYKEQGYVRVQKLD
jgi:hypothetical protein